MLLSGPPSTLIFFEPRIEVNSVVYAAAPKLDERNPELGKEGGTDPQILGRLLLGQASNRRHGQSVLFCAIARPLPFGTPRHW
jgi:hypothetical protein